MRVNEKSLISGCNAKVTLHQILFVKDNLISFI